jgi:hypothetical protein
MLRFVALLALAALGGCGPGRPPSLQDMADAFTEERAGFETLRRMSDEDYKATGVFRLSAKFVMTESHPRWPRPKEEWGLTEERWDAYRKLFGATGSDEGLLRQPRARDTTVRFILWQWRYFDSGMERGVMFSPAVLENHREDSDELRYMPLGNGWYAYGINGWQ